MQLVVINLFSFKLKNTGPDLVFVSLLTFYIINNFTYNLAAASLQLVVINLFSLKLRNTEPDLVFVSLLTLYIINNFTYIYTLLALNIQPSSLTYAMYLNSVIYAI